MVRTVSTLSLTSLGTSEDSDVEDEIGFGCHKATRSSRAAHVALDVGHSSGQAPHRVPHVRKQRGLSAYSILYYLAVALSRAQRDFAPSSRQAQMWISRTRRTWQAAASYHQTCPKMEERTLWVSPWHVVASLHHWHAMDREVT